MGGHISTSARPEIAQSDPLKTNDAFLVSLADSKRAASSLAESFADDKVARYYLQISDCHRQLQPKEEKLNLRIYECLTAAHCCAGLVIAAGPCYDSVGLWLPPDSIWTWKTYWRSKMWLLYLQFGMEGRRRFFGSWDTLEKGITSTMGSRASITWVLTDLGTREPSRGLGYATKVMEYGLGLADARSQPTYVECCDHNVSFYEKFGFQKKKQLALCRAQEPIILQTMVREPGGI